MFIISHSHFSSGIPQSHPVSLHYHTHMFLLFFKENKCISTNYKGSLGDYISAKLPCYWRLMDKFARSTSPLFAASPLTAFDLWTPSSV